jgi:hypothetical protein
MSRSIRSCCAGNRWRNEKDEHPRRSSETKDVNANLVPLTVRNALAHGNIVYLDKNGHERAGERLAYLALLSENRGGNGYRAAIFDEETFYSFLKARIVWLQTFSLERNLVFAEAAK